MIAIVGAGETKPMRKADGDIRSLTLEAVMAALDDAGLDPSDVDGIVTDAGIMPTTVPHEWMAAQLGIDNHFSAATSYGGTGIVAAPLLAEMAIKQGLAKVVLFYFGVDWGSRPGGPYAFHHIYPAKMAFEKPYGFSGQPSYFALWARRYMHEYGLREEDLGQIAIAQRENALRHGGGQVSRPMDMEGYFGSRMISDPLRTADCCLITDGAGAYIMTSSERARDCRKKPVEVMGVGFATSPISGDDVFTQKPDLLRLSGVTGARDQALGKAGVGLEDIDFAEIYDCFTISCLMQIEDLGFCKKGEGASFIRERGIGIDGGLPVNTHGGFLSYSYRLGIEHVIEAVRQLRGEGGPAQVADAKVGIVSGLSVPDYGLLVLGS
ncbi:acetyl-CoA acetyltransferase [Rhodoligotrophos appendicifer]|uniref:thiolase family protein n=1 Tax=Rhodoligotrophos appendicifer TaxID=987056 RepID=UPI00117CD889|nr:thiolase family protein [Rhodoligotrophos appendicifer]